VVRNRPLLILDLDLDPNLDHDLELILGLHSGWLQTDMGNRAAEAAHLSKAPHTLKEGVEAMIDLLDKANREEHGGKFLAYGIPGGALPW
jgi:norsolorinic acid ketoreductase